MNMNLAFKQFPSTLLIESTPQPHLERVRLTTRSRHANMAKPIKSKLLGKQARTEAYPISEFR